MENRSFEAESSEEENNLEIPKSHDDLESPKNQDIQSKDVGASCENEDSEKSAEENSPDVTGSACKQQLNDKPLQPEERVDVTKNMELPSQVTDRNYIYMPSCLGTSMSDKVWKNGGKWMWFCQGDIDLQNRVWLKLQSLVENGTFIGLKASTAKSNEGVINCYTADAEDKRDIKKTADALRKVTLDNCIMFYKTNEKSMQGKYSRNGQGVVSKYMHTVMGKLYEKDEHQRWTQVDLTFDD